MKVNYEGRIYDFDMQEMDVQDARQMEEVGIPNLLALEEGLGEGSLNALAVAYWQMLRQSGDTDARLADVRFKPLKLVKAFADAAKAQPAPKAGSPSRKPGSSARP